MLSDNGYDWTIKLAQHVQYRPIANPES